MSQSEKSCYFRVQRPKLGFGTKFQGNLNPWLNTSLTSQTSVRVVCVILQKIDPDVIRSGSRSEKPGKSSLRGPVCPFISSITGRFTCKRPQINCNLSSLRHLSEKLTQRSLVKAMERKTMKTSIFELVVPSSFFVYWPICLQKISI